MQAEIIKELGVKATIDPATEIQKRVKFIENKLKISKLKIIVLGISGGQDSTLAGKLCQMAIDNLGEEYQFIAVRLPYKEQFDEKDCHLALNFIKPSKMEVINIAEPVDAMVKSLISISAVSDFNKGNIKARMRMIAQYAVAGEMGALVCGTDHAAEAVTGFFTKFGDGGFDFAPLYGLNKRQGREILKELKAPKELYEKIPTADLEEEKPAISDEEALGLTYDEIDDFLEGKKIANYQKLIDLYQASAHKRRSNVEIIK